DRQNRCAFEQAEGHAAQHADLRPMSPVSAHSPERGTGPNGGNVQDGAGRYSAQDLQDALPILASNIPQCLRRPFLPTRLQSEFLLRHCEFVLRWPVVSYLRLQRGLLVHDSSEQSYNLAFGLAEFAFVCRTLPATTPCTARYHAARSRAKLLLSFP